MSGIIARTLSCDAEIMGCSALGGKEKMLSFGLAREKDPLLQSKETKAK
jgi:hypothetical protein